MFEYLSSVQSAVNRVNYNMKQLKETFGKDSAIYNEMQTKIDILFGYAPSTVKGNNDGLRMPSTIFKDEDLTRALEKLDKEIPRVGDLSAEYRARQRERQQAVEDVKRQGVESQYYDEYTLISEDLFGIDVDFKTYVNIRQKLPNALSWLYDNKADINDDDFNTIMSAIQGDTPGHKGSRGYKLAYSTLNDVLNSIERFGFNG